MVYSLFQPLKNCHSEQQIEVISVTVAVTELAKGLLIWVWQQSLTCDWEVTGIKAVFCLEAIFPCQQKASSNSSDKFFCLWAQPGRYGRADRRHRRFPEISSPELALFQNQKWSPGSIKEGGWAGLRNSASEKVLTCHCFLGEFLKLVSWALEVQICLPSFAKAEISKSSKAVAREDPGPAVSGVCVLSL